MKKIILFLKLSIICLSITAQNSYYYYKEQRIHLNENPLVRYVQLKQTVSETVAEDFHNMLTRYCSRTDEYTPYFNKYYINQEKYAEFLQACSIHDSIISLHTPNYAHSDTLSLYPTRTLFVKTKTSVNLPVVLAHHDIPYTIINQSDHNDFEYTIFITNDNALQYAAELFETGLFDYAEPDFVGIVAPLGFEDNPLFSSQWAVHNQNTNINLLPAWAVTTGHPEIKIAVIDCGVELNHSDLVDNLLEGYDAVDDLYQSTVCCGENETDFDWHGTCCAGIIGAANNSIGIVGVAHTSKIIPIRNGYHVLVYSREVPPNDPTWHWVWQSQTSWLIDALNHACYEDGADVISCSFMTLYPSNTLDSKVTEVCEYGREGKGCIVVAGAGNTYNTISLPIWDTLGYLARHPSVISVGSVTPCGKRVIYGNYCDLSSNYNSCYGDSLDVVAPGIHIPTTQIMDSYTGAFSGTSSATPHVSGIAALVLSVNPCLTREEVKYIIESTCTKVSDDIYVYGNNSNHPNGTWNREVGYGLVNAGAAVNLAQQMGGYTYVNDTHISSNTIWSTNKMINQDLTIDSLATLTITDTLSVGNSSKIIVQPGAKLVVDGGTLTSACTGEMWQGIEVLGDRTKRQLPQYQGKVELKNGARIENAHCAIYTGYQSDGAYATTGGIIKADSAFFINNRRSVAFLSYTNHTPTGAVTDNQSYFKRCEFTVDNNNLFSQNNSSFKDHVTMWEVRGVEFKGCTFNNLTSDALAARRHAIYAADAGFILETYCRSDQPIPQGCECSENVSRFNTFSGFNTAVEANTAESQYAVNINHALFDNNNIALKINGNNFVTVTRCQFDLSSVPSSSTLITGLLLHTCTGYKVEGNTFTRESSAAPTTRIGVNVTKSGKYYNTLYRNVFQRMTIGIHVNDTNGNSRTGLEFSCNNFTNCTYGLYAESGSLMAPIQGSISKGVDNIFMNTLTSSLNNNGDILTCYYHSSNINFTLYHPSGVLTESNFATLNPCTPTFCNGGGIQPLLTDFQSSMEAYATGDANTDGTDEMLLHKSLSETYYDAVRALMTDSVLDLNELEQWHTAAQPIADPYSLTETRFMMGYSEPFVAEADDAELANYAEFQAMKLSLRNNDVPVGANNYSPLPNGHINWYALTDAQIAQLQKIAERNTGRTSVMAKGVLCFFFGICYDDDLFVDDNQGVFDTPQQDGDTTMETRSKCGAMDGDAVLTAHPNPAADVLHIELRGAGIAHAVLYDLQGRAVEPSYYGGSTTSATLSLKSVPAGVYVLRVTDENGKEYHRKVVVK